MAQFPHSLLKDDQLVDAIPTSGGKAFQDVEEAAKEAHCNFSCAQNRETQ